MTTPEMRPSEWTAARVALESAGRLCVQRAFVCGLGASTLARLKGEARRAYIIKRQDFNNALVLGGPKHAPAKAITLAVEILEIEVDVLADIVTPYESKAIVSFFLEAAITVHAYRRAETEGMKMALEWVAGPEMLRNLWSDAENEALPAAP